VLYHIQSLIRWNKMYLDYIYLFKHVYIGLVKNCVTCQLFFFLYIKLLFGNKDCS
jgi:hypothetical protein